MDKNKKYLVVFGILALVIVTTAVSFAFFTYSRVGQTTTTITSGDIEFSFIEGDSAGLANAFPVSDEVGAQDTSEEYTFTVNLKSTSTSNMMNYNVYLLDANDEENTDYFTNEQIKFALIKDGTFVAGTSAISGKLLSEISGFDEGKPTGEGIVLENQEITSGKTDEYKLRIWISDSVNYSNTSDILDGTDANNDSQTSTGKYNGYKYSLKVKVTSVIDTSTLFNNLNISGRNISVELVDNNGLSAYAITDSSSIPEDDEWITVSNEISKNSVIRTTSGVVKNKTINYKVGNYKTYYLHVKNILNKITVKEINFAKGNPYEDASGANVPLIKTGMIPVIYDDGKWIKADETEKWYNYDEQWWANIVTVSESSREDYMNADYGTPINMDDINTMWVWIPRYEYETISSTSATEIKVNFLNGTESNKTDNYYTHPAFTFGTDELTGIWVAKFEASSDQKCAVGNYSVESGCDLTSLKVNIKPNATSWRGIRSSTLDLNTRSMNDFGNIYGFLENEVDTHAMKNMEWGALAYLTQSKYARCVDGTCTEVSTNSNSNFITGYSTTSYETEKGVLASSTGNIYGVYDMNGGSWEYVMGVIKDGSSNNPMSGQSGVYNSGYEGVLYSGSTSGREFPDKKYYDLYEYGSSTTDSVAYARYKIGDATTETLGWFSDFTYFSYDKAPWFLRSGSYSDGYITGIFCFSSSGGHASSIFSFRPVLVQK